jgi:hypothetical protein
MIFQDRILGKVEHHLSVFLYLNYKFMKTTNENALYKILFLS